MKKMFTTLICMTMVFGIGGCGSSRTALTDEELQKHFEDKGYTLACTNSGFNFCGFANTNEKKGFIYTDEGNVNYAYMDKNGLYSVAESKVLDGDGDAEKLKEEYEATIKDIDVTTDETSKFLKAKYDVYVSEQASKKQEEEDKVYGIGDTVTISQGEKNLFNFKINSVKTTDERNQFSDKKPEQVVVINYSYENENLDDDLFISSVNFTIIDEGGNVADTYPAGSNVYPKQSPKGAKSDGEESYGLKQESKTIKLRFSDYLPNGGGQVERNFVLKVD